MSRKSQLLERFYFFLSSSKSRIRICASASEVPESLAARRCVETRRNMRSGSVRVGGDEGYCPTDAVDDELPDDYARSSLM